MVEADRKDFRKAMHAIMLIYGKELHETATELLFTILKKYELNQITEALTLHVSESKFPPTPADIIQKIKGKISDRALIAFQHVLNGLNYYETVVFDDPVIHYAIECLGGWQKICQVSEEDVKWLEKDFAKYYELGFKCGKTWGDPHVPVALPGYLDLVNVQEKEGEYPQARMIETGAGQFPVKALPAAVPTRKILPTLRDDAINE